MAKFLNSLAGLNSGLKTIAIIRNNAAEQTIRALNELIKKPAMMGIKKIILKDADSRMILERENFCKNLCDCSQNFKKIQMIVL